MVFDYRLEPISLLAWLPQKMTVPGKIFNINQIKIASKTRLTFYNLNKLLSPSLPNLDRSSSAQPMENFSLPGGKT